MEIVYADMHLKWKYWNIRWFSWEWHKEKAL